MKLSPFLEHKKTIAQILEVE